MNLLRIVIIVLTFLLLKWFNFASEVSEIKVVNVGQGDSILIGGSILVDGGGNYEIDRYLSSLSLLNNCKLELVILTHPHYDHLHGLNRVLERCRVSRVLYVPVEYDSRAYALWKELVQEVHVEFPSAGDVYRVGDYTLEIVWPLDRNGQYSNINNSSLSFVLRRGNFSALFLGDLEIPALEKIDFKVEDLDVLKVPHHGGASSLHPRLGELKPKYCLFSLGEGNVYGHPHEEVLEFYEKVGCKILRTDLDGTIEVLLN